MRFLDELSVHFLKVVETVAIATNSPGVIPVTSN